MKWANAAFIINAIIGFGSGGIAGTGRDRARLQRALPILLQLQHLRLLLLL